MSISKDVFGKIDQKIVHSFTLKNESGMEVKISEFGATITSIKVPDRYGKPGEVVLGYYNLDPYLLHHPYIGSQVGRVANRITGAYFDLDGKGFKLTQNEGKNQLHGGHNGFSWVLWKGSIKDSKKLEIELNYISSDGEEGFPGRLDTSIIFSLDKKKNCLDISYKCYTDKSCPVNLTRHEYFNLNIESSCTALDQKLYILSKQITETGKNFCPTGRIIDISDDVFDFRVPIEIDKKIEQLIEYDYRKSDFDVNYILDNDVFNTPVAGLYESKTGHTLRIYTDQPCLQLFTGIGLSHLKSRSGNNLKDGDAVCLEPRGYPDAINQKSFPDSCLYPGEIYERRIRYCFSVI